MLNIAVFVMLDLFLLLGLSDKITIIYCIQLQEHNCRLQRDENYKTRSVFFFSVNVSLMRFKRV